MQTAQAPPALFCIDRKEKSMKKTIRSIACLLALTLILVLFASCGTPAAPAATGAAQDASGDLLARIRERGYITVATEGDWSPWTYHDEENTLVGFDVDLAKLLAEGLGVDVKFEETAWDSILAGVDSGRFDIACNGVSYTEERAEKYNFSTPYAYTGAVIVTRTDNEEIGALSDLAGKTTANTASSTYAAMAEEAGAVVQPVDTLTDTLNLVIDGRVDATLNARVTVEAYLNEHPDAPLKIACDVPGEQMVIPVRKSADTDSLLREIDRVLAELRESGALSELSVKYFGTDMTRPD